MLRKFHADSPANTEWIKLIFMDQHAISPINEEFKIAL